MSLKEKLKTINKNISNFAGQHNVKLIAVSKYASDEQVIEAYSEGIRIFGESYVVSALDRINRISNNFNNDVEWHLVGTLQKNKVKKAVGNFRLIQSVNSLELLKSIDDRSASLGIRQAVLIQINISNETNKNGFSPSSFTNELNNLLNFKNIEIRGLMAMNAHLSSESTLDENFRIMRNLLSLLQNQRPNAEFDLSIGMSSDYCAALQRGSTMIRIGKALFG
jgi:pyridoxal phosphate enzyme (YggS family)